MELTGERIKELFQDDPKKTSHALGLTLRDFGYKTYTDALVKAEIKRLLAGEEPRGGPSMFLAKWLKEGIDND